MYHHEDAFQKQIKFELPMSFEDAAWKNTCHQPDEPPRAISFDGRPGEPVTSQRASFSEAPLEAQSRSSQAQFCTECYCQKGASTQLQVPLPFRQAGTTLPHSLTRQADPSSIHKTKTYDNTYVLGACKQTSRSTGVENSSS